MFNILKSLSQSAQQAIEISLHASVGGSGGGGRVRFLVY